MNQTVQPWFDDPSNVTDAPTKPEVGSPASPWSIVLLLLAVGGIPASLLWDFSWESTVGIDLFWAGPHLATYLAVGLAGVIAIGMARARTSPPDQRRWTVGIGSCHVPLGAAWVFWGVLAFLAALLFDRWWQSSYGLAAGIWHPPQLLKTLAFFALLSGAWLLCATRQDSIEPHDPARSLALIINGGLIMALIGTVTMTSNYPNRQHGAWFYYLACATYPLILATVSTAAKSRWAATGAASVYSALMCFMVWVLPLVPASPETGPIYNPRDHLMPPPFPLLLILPAVALDLLRQGFFSYRQYTPRRFGFLLEGGLFFFLLLPTQWIFAEFLLSSSADNWFFAGGGRHWPFFLKIDETWRVSFWDLPQDQFDFATAMLALGLAMLSTAAGRWMGTWMNRMQR